MARSDEAWRAECEARYVVELRKQDRNRAIAYLERVEKKRGREAGQKLRNAVMDEWRRIHESR